MAEDSELEQGSKAMKNWLGSLFAGMALLLAVSASCWAECNPNLGAPCDSYTVEENLFKRQIGTEQKNLNSSGSATFEARLIGALPSRNREETLTQDPVTGAVGSEGEPVRQERGEQKPIAQIATFGVNHAVKSHLNDELWVQNMMNGWLSTKVGLASAAITFSQPAAATVYMNAVGAAYQHVEACIESHNTFVATLSQYPNGAMLRDIYLGCVERMTQEVTTSGSDSASEVVGDAKVSLCNAISVCQSDSYEPKTELIGGVSSDYWSDLRDRLNRKVREGFVPEHDPCHPLHPNLAGSQWSNAQIAEAGPDLVRSRLLLTDKLFCEYHQDLVTPSDSAKQVQQTGLLAESWFRKFVGNAALIWPSLTDTNDGAASIEWQKVQPRRLPWPPSKEVPTPDPAGADDYYLAPEVMPYYRAGETFVMLTQLMENRCRAHNVLGESAPASSSSASSSSASSSSLNLRDFSSLTRANPAITTSSSATFDGSGVLSFRNGDTDAPALNQAEFNQLIKEGFCNTELELIDQQRAFVSIPELPFSGRTCDAFWSRIKARFEQKDEFECDTLRGCVDSDVAGVTCANIKCKEGSDCPLSYAHMLGSVVSGGSGTTTSAGIENYPIWAQMLFAYSTVSGQVTFKNELRALYSQIEVMTGSRNTWMLQMAKELIESRLDGRVEDNNAEMLAALNKEIEKTIQEESSKRGGAPIAGSGGTSISRTAPGQSS